MAEFVTEEPKAQRRDTLGLVAGAFFAAVGLTYLIGGDHAVSDNWGLALPAIFVLLGVAGLAGSGLVRGSWRRRKTEPQPLPDGLPEP
ncbi:MAG: hypothetical protein QOJ11_52 [Frankiales bacterium]|jgi:hypothetical protein|nr:hypothetical protein [Frankiales bacterium]